MKTPRASDCRGILLIVAAFTLLLIEYRMFCGDSRTEYQSAQIIIPISLLISVAIGTVVYVLIRNNKTLKKLFFNKENHQHKPSTTRIENLRSLKKKLESKPDNISGIGTGVVKIFQHIKDNIGNLDTLTLGYRHLMDLSCEQLDFNAGAIFLISDHENMNLVGYSGLNVDSQTGYTVSRTGFIRDLMKSDVPRFEPDLRRIPGNLYGLFDGFKSAWLLPLVPHGTPIGLVVFLHRGIPEHREDYFPRLDFVGLAVSWFYENHSAQIMLERENKRSRMLVKTSLAISTSLDLDKVCDILVQNLGNYYGCSYSYIMLADENNNKLSIRQIFSSRGDEVFDASERFIDIEKISWLHDLIYLGNPVLLERDELSDLPQPDKARLKLENATMAMISPLKHGGKFVGVLVMVEQRSGGRTGMDSDVVNLTAAIVAQASAAIENARMYNQLADRVAHQAILTDVGQALNSDLDLIPFLERVLLTIAKNLNLPKCAFYLQDDSTKELYVAAIAGKYPEEFIGKRLRPGQGIAGNALYTQEPVNVDDVSQDRQFTESIDRSGSELAVPIILNSAAVGVLVVEAEVKYAFSRKDIGLLVSIVDQVAAAIEKLKLKQQEKERTSKLAITNYIVKHLSGIMDRNNLLGEAVKSIKQGFRFDLVAVFTVDDLDGLKLAQQSCSYGYGYEPVISLKTGPSLVLQAFRNQENKYSERMFEGEPDAGFKEISTHYCIPLVGIKQVHGVLEIQDGRSDAVTVIDKSTLQTIADFLALTLDNILLYQDIANKAERLSLVDQINQAISSTLEMEELFSRILHSLAEITGYHWATLVFKKNNKFKANPDFLVNFNPEGWGQFQIDNMIKYFDEVLVYNKPLYYNLNKMELPLEVNEYFEVHRINYLAISPIFGDDDNVCFLLVGNPNQDGFREQDQYLLADLTQHLKIALKNAMLYRELRIAYDNLSEAQEKIIQGEKFKALGEIATGIAHDFKNIMAAIMGRVQMLSMAYSQEGAISPETLKRSLDIIEKSADDGVKILSRINEFTKSKNTLNFERIDLREIINDTIELTRNRWDKTDPSEKISVKTKLDDSLVIQGDRPMMVEVFTNLINNAIDAINRAGKIKIKACVEDERVKIQFSDNGSGIPEEIISKVFDPFFTTKNRLGTGLGLAMVYSIIEGHGGSISVNSKPGEGTCFSIILPIAGKVVVSEKFSILIVEDDINLRNVLKEYFIELNADVMVAENCEMAMAILRQHDFDIIITDLGLPDKDGWGIIDSVRASSPDSFIVPMTGWNREIQNSEMLSRGLTDILKKPFGLEDVYKIVEKFDCKRKSGVNSVT